MAGLLIGHVAEQTGVPPATIRYYESIGLLAAPARSEAGYRRYTQSTVDELRFIRKAQALGFSLDEIGRILALSRSGKAPCAHVLALARQHLAAVDERLRQLRRFRKQLAAELEKWAGRRTPQCAGLCQVIANASVEPALPTRRGSDPFAPGHRPRARSNGRQPFRARS